MAEKIWYIVEAMGGEGFTYIVDLANELVDTDDMYIAYAVRKQTIMYLVLNIQKKVLQGTWWQESQMLF